MLAAPLVLAVLSQVEEAWQVVANQPPQGPSGWLGEVAFHAAIAALLYLCPALTALGAFFALKIARAEPFPWRAFAHTLFWVWIALYVISNADRIQRFVGLR